MKKLFVVLLIIFPSIGFGQELALVRDTVNKFEVGVPVGWRYGVPIDKALAFMALREKATESDLPRENYNINILNRNEIDINLTFNEFKKSIGKAQDFKIIEEGEIVINRTPYKWLIETHKNPMNGEETENYVFLANNEGKVLILTMVTTSKNFAAYKSLFDRIASSLKY